VRLRDSVLYKIIKLLMMSYLEVSWYS